MEIIDVAIGLAFLYLLLALVCTAVNELFASALNLRGKKLLAGIENLFRSSAAASSGGGKTITAEDIYSHPLVRGLYGDRWPSYMPSGHFALALMDTLLPADVDVPRTLESMKAQVEQLDNDSLRRTLLVLIANSGDDLQRFELNLESWFNQAMDRVSGWYKRQTQWITLAVALMLTVATNLDTIGFANHLSTDATLRQALVEQSKAYANRTAPPAAAPADSLHQQRDAGADVKLASSEIGARVAEIQALGMTIGWKGDDFPGTVNIRKVLGLLLTTLAVSLGAPFWFDLLSKMVNVRASGNIPEATPARTTDSSLA